MKYIRYISKYTPGNSFSEEKLKTIMDESWGPKLLKNILLFGLPHFSRPPSVSGGRGMALYVFGSAAGGVWQGLAPQSITSITTKDANDCQCQPGNMTSNSLWRNAWCWWFWLCMFGAFFGIFWLSISSECHSRAWPMPLKNHALRAVWSNSFR